MSGVMDRIREAAARAASGPLADARERPAFPRVAAQSPFPPEAGPEQFVARFRTELEALAGKVYGPLDADGVADKLIELIAAASSQPSAASGQPLRVLAWDVGQIPVPGLAERLRQASVELVPGEVPNDDRHQETLERLARIPVGLSGAVAGLADTGSVVVASGPGRARVASLLVPVHLAVLPVSRLYPGMADWLADGGAALLKSTANVVPITGPSRTADIELTLTLGMHGPREIHAVLYRG